MARSSGNRGKYKPTSISLVFPNIRWKHVHNELSPRRSLIGTVARGAEGIAVRNM